VRPATYRVVGNSAAGKSTFARALGQRLGLPVLELDGVFHRPGWTQAPEDEFQAEVLAWLAQHPGGWVLDGNYQALEGLVQPQVHVWLDFSRATVMSRSVRRAVRRVVRREELWNGNRERVRALLSTDPETNIVLWALTQHGHYRRRYLARVDEPGFVRLRTPAEAARWLASRLPCTSSR
jgi:shikimate kinase